MHGLRMSSKRRTAQEDAETEDWEAAANTMGSSGGKGPGNCSIEGERHGRNM